MRAFLIIIFSCLIFPNIVFANAKTELDKIIKTDASLSVEKDNSSTEYERRSFQKQPINKDDKGKNKSSLTNYQYDESNYHYYKYKKYVLDNENYAQSGRMKY